VYERPLEQLAPNIASLSRLPRVSRLFRSDMTLLQATRLP
jgi:hypothetical protein